MSFRIRCLLFTFVAILFLILSNKISRNKWNDEYDEEINHYKNEPWKNVSYDPEIEYRNYAIHPLANSILTALRRQVKSGFRYSIPETWALPPFGPLRENILIAPNYNLATCQIEKVMTTVRDAIFCYLTHPIGFKAKNRTLYSESWRDNYCGWSNYRSNIDEVERKMGGHYKRFVLIRDPFERFLSGYVDKCFSEENFLPQVRCLSCGYNIKCFVERLFHLLYGMHYNRTYLSREIWYVARHFAPQSWQCNFKKQLSTYEVIVYPESRNRSLLISKVFERVLKKAGVPRKIRDDITKQMLNNRSPHSTSKNRVREKVRRSILRDHYLRRILALIYYFDYMVFGFKMTPSLFD